MAWPGVIFVRDAEIRCTLPPDQVVGLAPLVVYTWNPEAFNDSSTVGWQASLPYFLPVACPEDFYGSVNEVSLGLRCNISSPFTHLVKAILCARHKCMR